MEFLFKETFCPVRLETISGVCIATESIFRRGSDGIMFWHYYVLISGVRVSTESIFTRGSDDIMFWHYYVLISLVRIAT